MDEYEILFKVMYAEYCDAVHQSESYKNKTPEQQQKTDKWLKGEEGKMQFLKESLEIANEQERKMLIFAKAGVPEILSGLEKTINQAVEYSIEQKPLPNPYDRPYSVGRFN